MRVVGVDGGVRAARELSAALEDSLRGGAAVAPLGTADPPAVRAALHPDEPAAEGTAAVVATSGASGEPKGVVLPARALTASARATHARLGGPGTWLLATPAQYVGGVAVLVRSLLAGTEPGVVDLSGGFRAQRFAEAAAGVLDSPAPRYTALVPTQLTRLLEAGGPAVEAARAFDAILLGGAATPPELRAAAEAAGLAVISSYGASETCGGCVYDGLALDGVELDLEGDGRIRIGGPVVAGGYRCAPERTRAAFADGWFTTGDLGRFTTSGRLEVLGRADDMINSGGVKVAAAAVERVLLAHPGVAQACVLGLADATWGQAVAAVVVPAEDVPGQGAPTEGVPGPSADELVNRVREHLGPHAAPRRLHFWAELPLAGPGKVDRAAVRAGLAG